MKPISDFYKNKSQKDGHNNYCKPCWYEITFKFQKTPKGKAIQKRYFTSQRGKEHRRVREKRYNQTEKGRENIHKKCLKRYWKDIEHSRLKNRSRYAGAPISILKAVLERDKVCQFCGTGEDLQFDHIHPVSLGGLGTLKNLQILCAKCNNVKSSNILLADGETMMLAS